MNIAKYIMLMGCTRSLSKNYGIEPDTKGRDIAHKLISSRLPGLPIVNNKEKNEVVGIITEFNLLGALREGMDADQFTADRIMSKEPVTAGLDTPAEELIEIMLEENFTMIPITKNNRLVGIVDRCSLMELYMTSSLERYVVK